MCWGKAKTPDLPPTPAPIPIPPAAAPVIPVPAAQPGEVAASAESKRKKVEALRYGAMGTIKNVGGAAGVSGMGINLSNPEAKNKVLGA